MSNISFRFPREVHTDAKGNQCLVDFYNFCSKHSNCCITIDWQDLSYMDANLSALLLAIIHKLKKMRNLKFYLDYEHLKGPMSVFWRNGLAHYIYNTGKKPIDDRLSTIAVRAFKIENVDTFAEYIERDLLKHRGVDQVKFGDKNIVKNSYFEIFNNYEIHSGTSDPVLACGQFFPAQKVLKFTLVDTGDGFLKKIAEHTKNTEKISNAVDAIGWAIRGGSTKKLASGGTGLKKILFYCMKSDSSIHIASNDCYWYFDDGKINNTRISNPFLGTTIHLLFRYK